MVCLLRSFLLFLLPGHATHNTTQQQHDERTAPESLMIPTIIPAGIMHASLSLPGVPSRTFFGAPAIVEGLCSSHFVDDCSIAKKERVFVSSQARASERVVPACSIAHLRHLLFYHPSPLSHPHAAVCCQREPNQIERG